MTLKCTSFEQMEKEILQRNVPIVVFRAGVLGTITTPEVLNQYNLFAWQEIHIQIRPWKRLSIGKY